MDATQIYEIKTTSKHFQLGTHDIFQTVLQPTSIPTNPVNPCAHKYICIYKSARRSAYQSIRSSVYPTTYPSTYPSSSPSLFLSLSLSPLSLPLSLSLALSTYLSLSLSLSQRARAQSWGNPKLTAILLILSSSFYLFIIYPPVCLSACESQEDLGNLITPCQNNPQNPTLNSGWNFGAPATFTFQTLDFIW